MQSRGKEELEMETKIISPVITREQYEQALKQTDIAREIIDAWHKQQAAAFDQRLKDNPVFTDDELVYSAFSLCPCGHGLAYPGGCGPRHYWDCSAILKGIADPTVTHVGKLPFIFYEIKGESERNGTTRGVFRPKVEKTNGGEDAH